METVIRCGAKLGNSTFSSINKAKNASRMLQKTGVQVRVIPHVTKIQKVYANGGQAPRAPLNRGEKA